MMPSTVFKIKQRKCIFNEPKIVIPPTKIRLLCEEGMVEK